MITEELLSYIKKQLDDGHSEETVRKILVDHKWKDADVEQAFSTILGAKPKNNQSDVASIMRPGFSGQQVQPVQFSQPQQQPAQIQTQPQVQTQPQFSQPQQQPAQFQPQTFQPQPIQQPQVVQAPQSQQPTQPIPAQEPVVVDAEPKLNPMLQQQFQVQPIEQKQEPVLETIIEPVAKSVEVKSEGPVFMPKTFPAKPFANIDSEKKVQFGAVIQPNEVKNPEVKIEETPIDAGGDFYKSLTTNTTESPAQNSANQEPRILEERKVAEFKKNTQTDGGRAIGQSMLKPKTFGPKVFGAKLQSDFSKMEPSTYGKFATPQANESMPTLFKKAIPPVGAMPANLYEKNRPEQETIKEAQNKMPAQMANQNNPNIIDRPADIGSKKSGSFLKKFFVTLLLFLIVGVGIYTYVRFFMGGINKDSKFMENFQNVSSVDFEINASGPILTTILPGSKDSTLLTAQAKIFLDIFETSNKISNLEINIKDEKELTFNVLSSPASSYVYTSYEGFTYKDQWIQLNGPFIQSFLPSMFSGTLPNGLVVDSGAVLSEATYLKLRQLFSQFPIISLTFDKGKEDINGKSMKVYSFELDNKALEAYLDEVSVLAKGSSGYEDSILKIKNLMSTIKIKEGTIWIGEDGLPYRIMAVIETLGSSNTSSINIEINSYNEKKNISIPNNFIKPEPSINGMSFAEGQVKDSVRSIFVDLQSIASSFKATNGGSFSGVCQDVSSGFFGRFKELETVAPNTTPVCKDGAAGFLVGAKYANNKYLCIDKAKIAESDESGINGEGLTCSISKEASFEDVYIKETITAFANIAKAYKTENQNSFGGLCASQSYLIFSRGLDSAVNKTPQCLSTDTGYAVFSSLSIGEYACVDATSKYAVVSSPRTSASCK